MSKTCARALAHLALAVLAACSEPAPSAPMPGARVERVTREVMAEFPEVARRFDGMSYDRAFREGGDLTQRGLPRLDDEGISAFMNRRYGLLSSSDEACIALVGGRDARAALEVLEAQSDDDLRAWIRLSTRAQSLELRGGARPLTTLDASRELTEAMTRIRAALSPSDAARWDTARSSSDAAEVCFLERTALRELLRMPAADAVRYQRAMLELSMPAP